MIETVTLTRNIRIGSDLSSDISSESGEFVFRFFFEKWIVLFIEAVSRTSVQSYDRTWRTRILSLRRTDHTGSISFLSDRCTCFHDVDRKNFMYLIIRRMIVSWSSNLDCLPRNLMTIHDMHRLQNKPLSMISKFNRCPNWIHIKMCYDISKWIKTLTWLLSQKICFDRKIASKDPRHLTNTFLRRFCSVSSIQLIRRSSFSCTIELETSDHISDEKLFVSKIIS